MLIQYNWIVKGYNRHFTHMLDRIGKHPALIQEPYQFGHSCCPIIVSLPVSAMRLLRETVNLILLDRDL